jgi:hypothetical protein
MISTPLCNAVFLLCIAQKVNAEIVIEHGDAPGIRGARRRILSKLSLKSDQNYERGGYHKRIGNVVHLGFV